MSHGTELGFIRDRHTLELPTLKSGPRSQGISRCSVHVTHVNLHLNGVGSAQGVSPVDFPTGSSRGTSFLDLLPCDSKDLIVLSILSQALAQSGRDEL